jgi:hypothetical protein
MKSLHYLFTHCQSLRNFCHHQTVVSITVCSQERSDIKYTWMSSPIYQNMVNFFSIRRCTSKLINVTMWEYCIYGEELLAPRLTPKLEDHHLSTVRGPLFNIRSYPSYPEPVYSNRNLRTRHVVVTRDPLTAVLQVEVDIIHLFSKLDTFDITPVSGFSVLLL